jgi:probable rRNA maturation factor
MSSEDGTVNLTIDHGPHPGVSRAEILRRIRSMIRELQLKNIEVSFVLTNDRRVHQLNKVYRGIDRTTDVLAFAMQEGEFVELAGTVLGDVIVSVPTAKKQAEARGAPVLDEVTMLLAHGLLHLLGWDHATPADDRRMRAETSRLCQAAVAAPRRKRASHSKAAGARRLSRNQSAAIRPRGRSKN